MTRIRRFLLALLLLPAVVLGCLLVFVSLLDPNQYKPELIEAVRLQTGRQLTLGGPVEIAWWPQIRVRASTLTIGNAAGFAPADIVDESQDWLWVTGLPDDAQLVAEGQDHVAAGMRVTPVVREAGAAGGG